MKAALIFMLAIGTSFFAAPSNVQKPDALADVPAAQRERLKSRLSEFVELHRSKQWARVYDFISEQSKNESEVRLTRERFLKEKLYSRVRRFTPRSATKMDDGWWMLWGCGSFERGRSMEAGVEAYFQDGDWYFSDIWSSSCIDCIPKECQH